MSVWVEGGGWKERDMDGWMDGLANRETYMYMRDTEKESRCIDRQKDGKKQ